jgi:hypothetical protein
VRCTWTHRRRTSSSPCLALLFVSHTTLLLPTPLSVSNTYIHTYTSYVSSSPTNHPCFFHRPALADLPRIPAETPNLPVELARLARPACLIPNNQLAHSLTVPIYSKLPSPPQATKPPSCLGPATHPTAQHPPPVTMSPPSIAAPATLEKKPVKFSNLLLGAGLNLFEVTTLGQPLEVMKTTMAANRKDGMAGSVARIWSRGGALGCKLLHR